MCRHGAGPATKRRVSKLRRATGSKPGASGLWVTVCDRKSASHGRELLEAFFVPAYVMCCVKSVCHGVPPKLEEQKTPLPSR